MPYVVSALHTQRTSDVIPVPEDQEALDTIQPTTLLVIHVIHIITSVVGVIGNVIIILVISINRKTRTVPNAFVIQLAVFDLLLCAIVIPHNVYWSLRDENIRNCEVMGPLTITVMTLSVLSMANIALNRYVLVCRSSEQYGRMYSKKNTAFFFVATYIYTALLLLPPFLGLGRWAENIKFRACSFTAYDHNSYLYKEIFLDTITFIPAATLCKFCYWKIMKKFRESRLKVAKAVEHYRMDTQQENTTECTTAGTSVAWSSTTGEATNTGSHKQEVTNTKAVQQARMDRTTTSVDAKTYRVIFSMILVLTMFMLFWLPIVLCALIDYWGRWPAHYYIWSEAFAWCNSCINIFLYAGLNPQFRAACKLLITGKFRQLNSGL